MVEPILIVGAGVGGLTAGVALEQVGLDVQIVERADELRTEGAGISIFQNALRCLARLDAADEVVAAGDRFGDGGLYTSSGDCLVATMFQDPGGADDLPVGVALHRGELVDILEGHLSTDVEFGAPVVDVAPSGSEAVATLEGGGERRVGLVVGCDGLHSAVRESLLPREANELRHAGYTSWRGLAEYSYHEPSELNPGEYWGVGNRFGVVPIGDDRVYWFAVCNAEPDTSMDGPVGDFLTDRFGAWSEPIPNLLRSTDDDSIIETDVYDRPPVDTWGRQRATLLGDAAHPMTPDLGQGGCQAIEDAWILGETLDDHRDQPVEGLRAYEAQRQSRTRKLVNRSRRMGRMAQTSNPLLVTLRNLAMRWTPTWLMRKQLAATLKPAFLDQ